MAFELYAPINWQINKLLAITMNITQNTLTQSDRGKGGGDPAPPDIVD